MARIKLNEIAVDVRETYKGSQKDIPIVGLEHITPENINLSLWDTNVENTFTKHFCKGDVLFGRRRAYLKKAALAPFDGICSGDITVIRAKDGVLDPSLLPFIIQNDQLFDFAVSQSAGSLSPRVKWEHLGQYELNLPSQSKQKELAETLWSIEDTLQAYKKLLEETDSIVKSQFVEMFGDGENNTKGYEVQELGRVCDIVGRIGFRGYTKKDLVEGPCEGAVTLSPSNIIDGELCFDNSSFISWDKYYESPEIMAEKGDIAFVKTASVGKSALFEDVPHETTINPQFVLLKRITVNPYYLLGCLQGDYVQNCIERFASGSTIKTLTQKQIASIKIVVPPAELQQKYECLKRQSCKSKTALLESITALQATKKSIMRDAFGC